MLTVITGPMFSGKTTALIRALRSYSPKEVLVIKPKIDIRYNKHALATHDGKTFPAILVDQINPQITSLVTPDVGLVAIDELNFFSFDSLYPQIQTLLEQKIEVITAGLSYDFKREPFGPALKLAEIADRVQRLTAKCAQCGKEAQHTYRKKKLKNYLAIGGAELYGTSCEECWSDLTTLSRSPGRFK